VKKKGWKTAEEIVEELKSNPEYQKMRAEKERKLQERLRASHEEQKELTADLSRVGVNVRSAWDLVNTDEPYPAAIPILVDHLRRPYSEKTKEGIARALAVPEAKDFWDILLEEFKNNPDMTTRGSKWGVGCALSVVALQTCRYQEALQLLRNKRYGKSRGIMLDTLAFSKDPEIRAMLKEFVNDPDFGEQAQWYLKHPGRQRK